MIIKNNGPQSFLIKAKESDLIISSDIKIGDFVINSPGEYEVKGIFVEAIDHIYKIFSEDLTLMCIFSKNKLSNEELEKIENIDILFIVVGGPINTKNALEMINSYPNIAY